ncbi:MAG TPA: serine/threonine-protein kinase [Chroococcales cyanobacterium]
MTRFDVTVKYEMVAPRVVLFAILALSPLWAVAVPTALVIMLAGMLIGMCVGGPTSLLFLVTFEAVKILSIFIGLLLVFGTGAAITVVAADNRVRISKDQISFPLPMARFPSFRRTFAWSDISKIEVLDAHEPARTSIVFYIRGERPICLKLRQLRADALEQMLLALELWGAGSDLSPALIQLREGTQELDDGSEEKLSYTEMWEAELNSRFAATAFSPLEPGESLQDGRIKVLKQLSFGGLSAVYLCQFENKELVILKEAVIPSSAKPGVKEKAQEQFEREAQFLMKVSHPAIVQVLDNFVDRGRTYLLLEHLDGQDLRQFVQQHGSMSEWQAINYGLQIATILQYLHELDPPLVHRDISPDNVVRKNDETLALIDFGAANEFVGTATGTLVGKQAFIAPEQFRGKAVTQSDLYALGCTIYYFLIGEEPEALSTSHPKEFKAEISEAVDQLVADLTAMEVEDRIGSAAQAKARMEEILAARPALVNQG